MNRLILISLAVVLSTALSAQTYTVSGGMGTPYAYDTDLTGMGIEKVYLLNTLMGATISVSSSASTVTFYSYQHSLGDKALVTATASPPGVGGKIDYTISGLEDGKGYWVEEVSAGSHVIKPAVWIIDYSAHRTTINSITAQEEADRCELLKLLINKSDDDLLFYAPKSVQMSRKIQREYTISYDNQVWKEKPAGFVSETSKKTISNIGPEVILGAGPGLPLPLKSTQFTLSGDQFAKHFTIEQSVSSAPYEAVAVQAKIVAKREDRDNLNEDDKEPEGGGGIIGGSAPVNIKFMGYGNDAAGYYTWLIYNVKDLNNHLARYTDQNFEYEFNRDGNYKVVLEVADKTSTCVDTASVQVNVSNTMLDVPNYFSPGDSPGSNDEFRVAYRSLVEFKCTIFNRWGVKLYEWRDPAKGWDGKHNGRYVAPGVYFYVIEAKGSDGKKLKKSGDINILRSK